jgi:hypothetical protein
MKAVYCVWAWETYYPKSGNGNLKGVYTSQKAAEDIELGLLRSKSYDHVEVTVEYVRD